MGNYFTKHHPPQHYKEIPVTYLYTEHSLNKFDHKIVQKWANAVITPIHLVEIIPIHMVAITPNHTVLQGCANAVGICVRTDTQIPQQ